MRDVAAGQGDDYAFRWIGGGARDAGQKSLIANVFRSRSFDTLKAGLLRQPQQLTALPQAYVDRVHTADLLSFSLQEFKKGNGGYPTFVYSDGRQVVAHYGYSGPQTLARLASATLLTAPAPTISYIDDPWTDLGPASGKPHETNSEFVIYSMPSENAVPVKIVGKDRLWPAPTKRMIGVRNQRWVSVDTGIEIGRNRYDGYIRLA